MSKGTHHFALFEFRDILLEDESALGFNLGLLPDGVLSEQLVSSSEGRVVEHVRVPLEHVTNGGAKLGQSSLSLLLLLRAKAVDILGTYKQMHC